LRETLFHHRAYDILQEAERIADGRNGFIEADVVAQDGSERYW
jgi:hypothetical protein